VTESDRAAPLYADMVSISDLGGLQLLTFQGPGLSREGNLERGPVCAVVIHRDLALRLSEIAKAAVMVGATAKADMNKPQ
jgi:hypothetical protein